MAAWRIWYAGGSTFSSDDGPPEHSPPLGVLVIAFWDRNHGKRLLHGFDWYYAVDGSPSPWWGSEIHGLLAQLLHDRDRQIRAIRQGWLADDRDYERAMSAAAAAKDIAP